MLQAGLRGDAGRSQREAKGCCDGEAGVSGGLAGEFSLREERPLLLEAMVATE